MKHALDDGATSIYISSPSENNQLSDLEIASLNFQMSVLDNIGSLVKFQSQFSSTTRGPERQKNKAKSGSIV